MHTKVLTVQLHLKRSGLSKCTHQNMFNSIYLEKWINKNIYVYTYPKSDKFLLIYKYMDRHIFRNIYMYRLTKRFIRLAINIYS